LNIPLSVGIETERAGIFYARMIDNVNIIDAGGAGVKELDSHILFGGKAGRENQSFVITLRNSSFMGIKNQISAGFEFPVIASPNEFFSIYKY